MATQNRNRRPVQRISPEVYRRRRLVVLGVLVALIAAVIWLFNIVFGAIQGFFNPSASMPQATAGPGGVTACEPGVVSVIAGVGSQGAVPQAAFAATETPYIWYSVTNNSDNACSFDLGTSASFFKITSGSSVIWDSHNCDRTQDVSSVQVLQPGQVMTSGAAPWAKVYSSASGCSTGQTAVPTGGASYHLVATVNGVDSSDVQFLLN